MSVKVLWMQIIFLVMKAPYKPWDDLFEHCAGRTWASNCSSDQSMQILKYCGKPLPSLTRELILYVQSRKYSRLFWSRRRISIPKAEIDKDTIEIKVYDTWKSMFTKFIGALNWVLENENFDYIVRINSTAYVNVDNLRKFLSGGVDYAGPSNGKKFASGWGIILSKYAAKELISYVKVGGKLSAANDDRLIGDIMKKKQIDLTLFRAADYEKEFVNKQLRLDEIVMLRVKNKSSNRIRLDSEAFEAIYKAHLAN